MQPNKYDKIKFIFLKKTPLLFLPFPDFYSNTAPRFLPPLLPPMPALPTKLSYSLQNLILLLVFPIRFYLLQQHSPCSSSPLHSIATPFVLTCIAVLKGHIGFSLVSLPLFILFQCSFQSWWHPNFQREF